MKIRYIPYLTIVLAALLLSACHSIMDDEVCVDQPSDTTTPVQIGFTLTTGDVSSRAITEEEEAGTGRENYIDIANNNFRILLFKTDNTYLTALKVNRITQTGNDGTTYYVEGELDEAYTDFKLVVLANWGTYADNWTSETTIANVCKATYSYSSSFNIDNDLIPMYGVQTYSDVEFRADLLTQLTDEIDLLRAMAKIEVTCSAPDIELTDVTLHYYNTSGMCAPKNIYNNTAAWDVDTETDCSHEIHLPFGITPNEKSLPFKKVDESYIIYVPEFDNTDVTKSFISVSLEHADGTEVNLDNTNIYFGEYTDEGTLVENTGFDIVRNHWYKYDITNVDDGELIFQYRVRLWNVKESVIGWNPTGFLLAAWNNDEGNKEKAKTDATIGDTEAVYCYVCNPGYDESDEQYHTLKDGTSGAAFSFTLQIPAGATWKGYLTNNEDFYFSYGEYWNGTKHAVSVGRARTEEYQIKIQARHAWTQYEEGTRPRFDAPNTEDGNRFKELQGNGGVYTDFYIIVSPDGNESNDYKLMINPDNAVNNNKTYYKNGRRFAGPDEYHVRIWQLKATYGIDNYGELFNDSEDIKEFRK